MYLKLQGTSERTTDKNRTFFRYLYFKYCFDFSFPNSKLVDQNDYDWDKIQITEKFVYPTAWTQI